MKPHLNLMAQLICTILCTGLTKTHTSLKKKKAVKLPGGTVWCDLSSRGIVGPYIVEGTVTGEKYLQMLETTIPRLNDLLENENGFYFQQDGAPAHFHANVRNFLDRTLNQRWIERRGSAAEFPPRSPDLTLPDFYIWGVLKDTVYATKPQTLEELRVQIEHACDDIPLETIQLVAARRLIEISQHVWPPRSPDLNSLHFFLWGHLKSLVYSTSVGNEGTFRQHILQGCQTIRTLPRIWELIQISMKRPTAACIQIGSGHFEQFM
ncbi:hypothetical protein ANN_01133 [Periplaneta americana]|uniref:Uncharacterized protein n=1 Tax=Periplaneta americana TaxID=6978 RepID=A0ABQ8TSU9_PERAM|nr:hypothetical protein ANN_01133 [Periplaneta americana]